MLPLDGKHFADPQTRHGREADGGDIGGAPRFSLIERARQCRQFRRRKHAVARFLAGALYLAGRIRAGRSQFPCFREREESRRQGKNAVACRSGGD